MKSTCPVCKAVGSLEEQQAALEDMQFEIQALTTGAPQIRPHRIEGGPKTCLKCGVLYTVIDPKVPEHLNREFLQTWARLVAVRREKGTDRPDRL